MVRFFIFIMGAVIGSFLNVCIYRMPKNESIVMPPSHCPNCAKPIPWYDNIPIISYLVLAGKCRSCKTRISFRYPLVEALTALALTAFFFWIRDDAEIFRVFGHDMRSYRGDVHRFPDAGDTG